MYKTILQSVSYLDNKYRSIVWKFFFSKDSMRFFGTSKQWEIKLWKDVIWIWVYNSIPKQTVFHIFTNDERKSIVIYP